MDRQSLRVLYQTGGIIARICVLLWTWRLRREDVDCGSYLVLRRALKEMNVPRASLGDTLTAGVKRRRRILVRVTLVLLVLVVGVGAFGLYVLKLAFTEDLYFDMTMLFVIG